MSSGLATLAVLGPAGITATSLAIGAILIAVAATFLLVRQQRAAARSLAALEVEAAALRDRLDDAEALIALDAAVIVSWQGEDVFFDGRSDPTTAARLPQGMKLLAFGEWLVADSAQAIEERVTALRLRGEAFSTTVRTRTGLFLSAEGRIVGGRAVMKLRNVSGDRRSRAQVEERARDLERVLALMHQFLDALDAPAWIRDGEGNLAWTNAAYARAVEAEAGPKAAAEALEFLDSTMRGEIVEARARGEAYRQRVPAVVAGTRRMFDVVDVPSQGGSAGIALDVSDAESLRTDLSRRIEAHRRTLDEIATAVAIFRADQILVFHNQAYRQLWNLDPAFLEQGPTDGAILEKLRAARQLPEQSDFRAWKDTLHESYRALESRDHWWHLPDGRTVRVVVTPNPEGGVTYLFEDATERLGLESRYNALIRVQTETLDHLSEAVAVFGSDGRLKLSNDAFARLWQLQGLDPAAQPHASQFVQKAIRLHADPAFWERLRLALTAMSEERVPHGQRIERNDGRVLDVSTVPLPDGATMLTFRDVSATVQVERALRDRNEALEVATQLKNDFVKHVSYELRTPLTVVIGYAQLLGEEHVGALNERQREYAGHVLGSGNALLAIINDILDLATIDAGVMELNLTLVDIAAVMHAAAEGIRDRVVERDLRLEIVAGDPAGHLVADETRLRQILFNLLGNAVTFSAPGGRVRLEAERAFGEVIFRVHDEGAGIPPELLAKVFDRFESHAPGVGARGVGLGLPIVRSFVELHGGTVDIVSQPGRGTTVTCRFPARVDVMRGAA